MTHPPKIHTRAMLMDALRLASELEHGLMVQYLFAAYTIRRYPYERFDYKWNESAHEWDRTEVLTEAQLERVRRWGMKVTLIARQEMEHLGLALNLLSAIGGTPSFSRPNMPQRDGYYGTKPDIKLTLTRCDLATIKRFQLFEKPDQIDIDDREAIERWCRQARSGPNPDAVRESAPVSELPLEDGLGAAPHIDLYGVPFNSVQELYEEIERGFIFLTGDLGECNLFVGKPSSQVFGGPKTALYNSQNNLNQYGLSLIAVTDLKSARQAITMIVEQGEGAKAPPVYRPDAHFCLFTDIRREMEYDPALREGGARHVCANPLTRRLPDVSDEFTLVDNRDTVPVAELFNQSYEVMLLLLLYLYSDQVKTEDQLNALMDAAFFPFMTMFIRPLAEILTELPASQKDPRNMEKMAGPGFELAGDVMLFPNLEQTWTLFQERIDALVAGFRSVTRRAPLAGTDKGPHQPWVPAHDPWRELPSQEDPAVLDERKRLWDAVRKETVELSEDERHHAPKDFLPSLLWLRLYYVRQNMDRLSLNWKNDWLNIGRSA